MQSNTANFSRRRFIHALGAGALLAGTAPWLGCSRTPRATKPNIIFIMADDLGYGDLGCYGSTKIRTPNIDRLATQGTRFTQAYSGSPVCAPARCELMTGLHTGHARIRDNNPQVGGELEEFAGGAEGGIRLSLEAEDITVAETLKAAGYATGIAGKWGIGEPGTAGTPNKQGFDEFLGYLNQNHAPYYFTDYLDENEGRREIPENANGARVVYSNDLFDEFSIRFIEKHRDHPFFLYLPYTIPHDLIEVPDIGSYADEDWPEDAMIYAAMVTRLDGYVGRLMETLDRLGLAENTLVMFTSDNGPKPADRVALLRSAADLRGAKSSLYEGGIRVPMIARWPGHVPAGATSDEPWMFADVMPTCAELADVASPDGIDGKSVLPVLTGKTATLGERPLYWEFPRERLHQAARFGRWKAVRFGVDQPIELYDLTSDPAEVHDVAQDHPAVVASLKQIMDSSHIPSPHWPVN
jgi:arylsulfatase A-like enzyme